MRLALAVAAAMKAAGLSPLDWVGLAAAVAVLVSFAAAVAIGKFIRAGRGPDPRK